MREWIDLDRLTQALPPPSRMLSKTAANAVAHRVLEDHCGCECVIAQILAEVVLAPVLVGKPPTKQQVAAEERRVEPSYSVGRDLCVDTLRSSTLIASRSARTLWAEVSAAASWSSEAEAAAIGFESPAVASAK